MFIKVRNLKNCVAISLLIGLKCRIILAGLYMPKQIGKSNN
jgi:hypothetical protein